MGLGCVVCMVRGGRERRGKQDRRMYNIWKKIFQRDWKRYNSM